MPLRVVSCYSYRTSIDSPWTDAQLSVNQYVDALKGREVRGYGHVPVRGIGVASDQVVVKRKISELNASDAVDWYGEMGARILAEADISEAVLIPIPNCDCTIDGDGQG